MGRIFGISDLPVSTIMTPFEPQMNFISQSKLEEHSIKPSNNKYYNDCFVTKKMGVKSNPIIKMRNGFGKLMKHFSKKI